MTEEYSYHDTKEPSKSSQEETKGLKNKGKRRARDAAKPSPDARHARKRQKPEKAGVAGQKRETRTVSVESPYGKGEAPDRVERVVDTIALMHRAHQIDHRQESAARKVQAAWEMAPASLKCALGQDNSGGGSGTGSPTERQLYAGRALNDVRAVLGNIDSKVVLRVCGMGYSIVETARMMFAVRADAKVSKRDEDRVGSRLRMGLTELADHWWPKPPKLRAMRGGPMTPDARPTAAATPEGVSEIVPGRVYHGGVEGGKRAVGGRRSGS